MKKFLQDDIVVIENFITEEEAKKTIDLFNIQEEIDPNYWSPISFYESYAGYYPEPGSPLFEKAGLPGDWFKNLQDRFKQVAAEAAGKDVSEMHNLSFHMQRWLPGAFAHYHSDNSDNDGAMGAFTRSRYAVFMYLNEDFEGGELVFEKTDDREELNVKPKTGLIAGFHGGHKNRHQVTVVKGAPRYTIGSFWDDRAEEDYPQEIRDAWAAELKQVREKQEEEYEEWAEIREKGLRITPNGETYSAELVERK